jgi:exopolyphosphatase/guanosine-5'-triphosphate,3'-diphosphate pyrophosphatase
LKLASIDIGSNAVRLLLSEVIQGRGKPVFKKMELVRVPLRLGEDAFIKGRISKQKENKLILAMKAFKNLIDAFEAAAYRACATASMREAKNSHHIIKRIYKESKIKVEVIDGKTEAGIIFSNHVEQSLNKRNSYLYIDIGGGSTELTLFSKGKCLASQSFNIGTIRLLHKQINREYWDFFKAWIKLITKDVHSITAIGSGGNINKLYKMIGKNGKKSVDYSKLKNLCEKIESYSYEERIRILGLHPDRADVIVPASKILLTVMKIAEINEMIVPQIGMTDGIIHQLYEAAKKPRNKKFS